MIVGNDRLKSIDGNLFHILGSLFKVKVSKLVTISMSKINQPCNKLYPKKPAGMHWLSYNNAVSWLNEAKTRIFQPTANYKISKFTCISSASLP